MASNNDIFKVRKMWNIPQVQESVLRQSVDDNKFKFYKFSSIPLICRANKCKFNDTCTADCSVRIDGSRCFVEVSTIINRFEELCSHFGINIEGDSIDDKDCVDASMIRDIIDIEIQMLRADNKIALSGDFMAEHIAQIDKKGNAYYEEIVHPAIELKLKLIDQRNKTLTKLNATRKDKADLLKSQDYSTKAMSIIDTIKQRAGMEINLDNLDDLEAKLNNGGETNV